MNSDWWMIHMDSQGPSGPIQTLDEWVHLFPLASRHEISLVPAVDVGWRIPVVVYDQAWSEAYEAFPMAIPLRFLGWSEPP
jgi:hypothetical protein